MKPQISDSQTAPRSRHGRIVYGASTAAIAAGLVSSRSTEFGIKLSILPSLTVGCALVPFTDGHRRIGGDEEVLLIEKGLAGKNAQWLGLSVGTRRPELASELMRPRPSLRQAVPWAGLVLSLWALLPPYTSDLNTEMRVEVADHVVPGVIMLGVCVAMVVRGRRGVPDLGMFPLVAGLVILLAGLWMTATHIPLVNQARRGDGSVASFDAAWHTVPGVVVLVLGLVWTAAWWSTGEASGPAPSATSSPGMAPTKDPR